MPTNFHWANLKHRSMAKRFSQIQMNQYYYHDRSNQKKMRREATRPEPSWTRRHQTSEEGPSRALKGILIIPKRIRIAKESESENWHKCTVNIYASKKMLQLAPVSVTFYPKLTNKVSINLGVNAQYFHANMCLTETEAGLK